MEVIFNAIDQSLDVNDQLDIFKDAMTTLVDQKVIFNGGKEGSDSYFINSENDFRKDLFNSALDNTVQSQTAVTLDNNTNAEEPVEDYINNKF